MGAVVAVLPELLEGVQILSGLAGAAWSIEQVRAAIQTHAKAHPEDLERLKSESPSLAARVPAWLEGSSSDPQMQATQDERFA